MSADGTTFVAGTPSKSNKGHVRTYKINETIQEFSQLGYDLDSDAAGGLFGWSVSMSANGTVFVLGAPK